MQPKINSACRINLIKYNYLKRYIGIKKLPNLETTLLIKLILYVTTSFNHGHLFQ